MQERLSANRHWASILIYQTTPRWAWKRPSAVGEATSGKLIFLQDKFSFDKPIKGSFCFPPPLLPGEFTTEIASCAWTVICHWPPKLKENVNPGFGFHHQPSRICKLGVLNFFLLKDLKATQTHLPPLHPHPSVSGKVDHELLTKRLWQFFVVGVW